MLNTIRKNVRNPYIQAALGAIILVFIFFFGWGMRSQRPAYVAKVNGDTIDLRTYQETYNRLVEFYKRVFGDRWEPEKIRELGLGRRALDQLIDEVLLLQEADRRDIEVSDDEVAAAIQSVEAFQDGGAFSKERYLRILEANRLTPLEYESAKRRELLLQKVEQAIRSEVRVTEEEIASEYRQRNTRGELAFVAFRPAAFEADVTIDEKALAEFYEAEKERYREPERRSARYILFAPEAFFDEVEVTDEEIAQEYNWRMGEFAVPEAVRARHILLRLPPDADEATEQEVREKIETIRKKILEGADFAKMARKYSEDPGSRDKGGDLGYFERGKMVPAFEEAAFSLEPGTVSEPVKTRFGYHLILVEDHRQAHQKTLDEVRDRIERDIRRRKALELAYTAADNTLMDLEDGQTTWEALAEEYEVRTTDPITREETVPGVAKPESFREILFSLAPDKPGELLETSKGTYLIAVAEVRPSEIPPLEKVRARVEADYRKAQARRLAEEEARKFLETARERGWDEAVKAAGLKAETTGAFAQKGGAVPRIGWAPDLKEAVFQLDPGEVAAEPFEVNGVYYAVRLLSRTEPDMEGLQAERDRILADILPRKQTEHFQEYLEKLRKEAEIEINEELLI